MEQNEIKRLLEEYLYKDLSDGKKRHIVFWYDDAGEFKDEIDELSFSGAKVLKLNGRNSFYVKYILEHKDTESNYLIYAPYGKPAPRENYLLDIQKYSSEFSTDKATLIMRELKVNDDSLRTAFKKHLRFFRNKERYRALKSYALTSYTEDKLDIAVLSVLCKLPYPDLAEVLKVLLTEYAEGKSAIYQSIGKFGDISAFWDLVKRYYGYDLEQQDLGSLSMFFLVSGLSFSLNRELPKQWEPYVSVKQNDAVVFLNHFMSSSTVKAYSLLSNFVAEKLNLKKHLEKWEIDSYKDSDLFSLFDEGIIQNMISNLLAGVGEFGRYQEIILDRRTKYWYKVYENEYNAVYWACVLLNDWKKYKDMIKDDQPADFFERYVGDYCNIDTAYRKFTYSFDRMANKEWFAELREMIENTYINGYMNALSIKWSSSIEGLQEYWGIGSVHYQWEFYQHWIEPHVQKGERVFVIISDGLSNLSFFLRAAFFSLWDTLESIKTSRCFTSASYFLCRLCR
jgi:uncharacterized protein (TIGR02687 family)